MMIANSTNATVSDIGISSGDICFIVVPAVIFSLGLCGNVQVIRYYGFHKKKDKAPIPCYDIFILHLAVCNLILSIVTPIHFVYSNLLRGRWHFGSICCVIVGSLPSIAVMLSSWIVVWLCDANYHNVSLISTITTTQQDHYLKFSFLTIETNAK